MHAWVGAWYGKLWRHKRAIPSQHGAAFMIPNFSLLLPPLVQSNNFSALNNFFGKVFFTAKWFTFFSRLHIFICEIVDPRAFLWQPYNYSGIFSSLSSFLLGWWGRRFSFSQKINDKDLPQENIQSGQHIETTYFVWIKSALPNPTFLLEAD